MKRISRKAAMEKIANAIIEGGLEPDQIAEWIIGYNAPLNTCDNADLEERLEFITGDEYKIITK